MCTWTRVAIYDLSQRDLVQRTRFENDAWDVSLACGLLSVTAIHLGIAAKPNAHLRKGIRSRMDPNGVPG
jgi:hypothetical protein